MNMPTPPPLRTVTDALIPASFRLVVFLHRSNRESNPGPSRGSPLQYRCAKPAHFGFFTVHSNLTNRKTRSGHGEIFVNKFAHGEIFAD